MKIIAMLAGLLGGKTWLAWLLSAAAVLTTLVGLAVWIDQGGYRRATLEWTVKYEQRERAIDKMRFDELERQAFANDQAKAAERAALEELERELAERELLIDQLREEAAADPDAEQLGINAAAVARINRIQ